ncbi:alanine--tRNA ligase [Bacilliculturomica massiliensis]|uniref:alanine--tRNA ligase n=1 Tax=Bacilliculturomica massiliensis TaxID=1917867 RepID=UPI0010314726|nr:alanine--tRNA ligase [Bacilliculturomica massiliensis]
MKNTGLNELRTMFRKFYESKGHYPMKSFSLVPNKDKSLLLINSGMAPMKPFFAGIETPPSKRVTTCQKCIRTGDIDIVGQTDRHGTFFEMMGSFSFGEYFKEQSIKWGWEFITQVLEMPEDKIWATIYLDDDEAYNIWRDVIGMPEEHIVRLGKEDNFWEIGTGPCGPCSEIYFDRGPEYGCGNPECKPGCDCDRYIEFWNHVFTQFDRQEDGSYVPLEHPNIDTGMGLERLACIMQDVTSIFDVDTIRTILDEVVRISGVPYHDGAEKTDTSIRIITDHIRSITFMVGDGVLPSNEGRGYVLRRLLRRAARHGKLLGIQGAFLASLSEKVIEVSGVAYPELEEKREYIHRILSVEEEKFSETIDQGTNILEEYLETLKKSGEKTISGEQAFKLYDTFGFPLELTQEIAGEQDVDVDVDSFNANMQRQKEMARAARKSDTDAGWADESILYAAFDATEFLGYDTLTADGTVKGIFKGRDAADVVSEGETAKVILDRTPFYGEGGGQAGDVGLIYGDSGCQAEVTATTKFRNVYVHHVTVRSGELRVDDKVSSIVIAVKRNQIARNHTATHLLHKTLREVLGNHVEQAGSSVTEHGLRFDFTHFEAVPKETLAEIENIVNEKILQFIPVTSVEMPIEEAEKTGATSLFGEKYGKLVRVVSIGDYSIEFCGGTHVSNSGQIGALRILSESGVAAGVRRIEAVTGTELIAKLNEYESLVGRAAEILKTNPSGLLSKIEAVSEEAKACKKELEEMKMQAMGGQMDQMIESAREKNGVKLITRVFEDTAINDLRKLSDEIKAEHKGVIMVFAAVNGEKVTLMVSVSDDLLEKGYHAGSMIKQIAAAAGGGGGGKADMAQAGAKDKSRLPEAFELAYSLL